jgi:hypothetical protein
MALSVAVPLSAPLFPTTVRIQRRPASVLPPHRSPVAVHLPACASALIPPAAPHADPQLLVPGLPHLPRCSHGARPPHRCPRPIALGRAECTTRRATATLSISALCVRFPPCAAVLPRPCFISRPVPTFLPTTLPLFLYPTSPYPTYLFTLHHRPCKFDPCLPSTK